MSQYAQLFDQYTSAYSLPPGYLDRLAEIESGGDTNIDNPLSSAGGLFQFVDATAREYGLSDRKNPEQATEAAARLTRDNRNALRRGLGREPTPEELYLAHQQGATGALRILSNPDADMTSLVGSDAANNNRGAGRTGGEFANFWASKWRGEGAPAVAQADPMQTLLSRGRRQQPTTDPRFDRIDELLNMRRNQSRSSLRFEPNLGPDVSLPSTDILAAQRLVREYQMGMGDLTPTAPANLGETFSQGIRVGRANMDADFAYFDALIASATGSDSAEAKLEQARYRREQASAAAAGMAQFDQFLEEPTIGGFATQVASFSGQLIPSIASSIAGAAVGTAVAFAAPAVGTVGAAGAVGAGALKVGLSTASKAAARRLIEGAIKKKVAGEAVDEAEEKVAQAAYDLARRNAVKAARNRRLRRGAVGGALATEYPMMSGASLSEFDEAGVEIDQTRALQSAAIGGPLAAIGVGGEAVLMRSLLALAKREAAKETGDGIFTRFVKEVGGSALKTGTIEGATELAQEEILIQQRRAVDADYDDDEANLRRATALFAGFFGGGTLGGVATTPISTVNVVRDSIATKAKEFGDKVKEAQANAEMDETQMGVSDENIGSPAPESAADINAQMDALDDPDSGKQAVWVPETAAVKNETIDSLEPNVVTRLNDGLVAAKIPGKGVIITKSQQLAEEVVRAEASDESLSTALGFSGIKPEGAELVVRVKDKNGNIVSEEATDRAGGNAALDAAKRIAGKGDYKVEVVSVEQALKDRKERVSRRPQKPSATPTRAEADANFGRWFRNSKAVESDGSPTVFYHGTRSDFDSFDGSVKEKRGGLIYFSKSAKFASDFSTPGQQEQRYAKDEFLKANPDVLDSNGQIIPEVLHSKEQELWDFDLPVMGDTAQDTASNFAEFDMIPGARVMPVYLRLENTAPLTPFAEAEALGAQYYIDRGYDSVMVDEGAGEISYAVFDPKQIKSVYNRGTFDPDTPKIREMRLSDEDPDAQEAADQDVVDTFDGFSEIEIGEEIEGEYSQTSKQDADFNTKFDTFLKQVPSYLQSNYETFRGVISDSMLRKLNSLWSASQDAEYTVRMTDEGTLQIVRSTPESIDPVRAASDTFLNLATQALNKMFKEPLRGTTLYYKDPEGNVKPLTGRVIDFKNKQAAPALQSLITLGMSFNAGLGAFAGIGAADQQALIGEGLSRPQQIKQGLLTALKELSAAGYQIGIGENLGELSAQGLSPDVASTVVYNDRQANKDYTLGEILNTADPQPRLKPVNREAARARFEREKAQRRRARRDAMESELGEELARLRDVTRPGSQASLAEGLAAQEEIAAIQKQWEEDNQFDDLTLDEFIEQERTVFDPSTENLNPSEELDLEGLNRARQSAIEAGVFDEDIEAGDGVRFSRILFEDQPMPRFDQTTNAGPKKQGRPMRGTYRTFGDLGRITNRVAGLARERLKLRIPIDIITLTELEDNFDKYVGDNGTILKNPQGTANSAAVYTALREAISRMNDENVDVLGRVIFTKNRAVIVLRNSVNGTDLDDAAMAAALGHELGHLLYSEEISAVKNGDEKTASGFDVRTLKRAYLQQARSMESRPGQYTEDKYGFEEWYSDQVAAYVLGQAKSASKVGQYFSSIAAKLKVLFNQINKMLGGRLTDNATFQKEYMPRVLEARRNTQRMMERDSNGNEISVMQGVVIREMTERIKQVVPEAFQTKLKAQMARLRNGSGASLVRKMLFANDDFLRGLDKGNTDGPGHALARIFYGRSQSREDIGYHARQNLAKGRWSTVFLDIFGLDERSSEAAVRDPAIRAALLEAEDHTRSYDSLSPEAKKVRDMFDDMFDYIEEINQAARDAGRPPPIPITKRENFFHRVWDIQKIVASPAEYKAFLMSKGLSEMAADNVIAVFSRTDMETLNFVDLQVQQRQADPNDRSVVTDIEADRERYTFAVSLAAKDVLMDILERNADNLRPLLAELKREYGNSSGANILNNVDPAAATDAEITTAIETHWEEMTRQARMQPGMQANMQRTLSRISTADARNAIEGDEDGWLINPYGAVIDYIHQTTRAVEFERMGGYQTVKQALDQLSDKERREAEYAVEGNLGKIGKSTAPIVRKINSASAVLTYTPLLLFTVLASFTDNAGIATRAKEFSNLSSLFNVYKKTLTTREYHDLARATGNVTATAIDSLYMSIGELDFMGPTARKILNAYFKYTGLNWWTRTTRVAAVGMGREFLLNTAKNPDFGERQQRYLDELNVSREDVLAWEKSGYDLTTPEGIRVRDAIGRFAEESIIRPNAAQRPVWGSDPHFQVLMQLKSYYYAWGKVVVGGLGREVQNRFKEDGTYSAAIMPMLLMAGTVFPLTMLGLESRELFKYLLQELIPGVETDPEIFKVTNMDPGEYAWELTERSGLLGPVAMAFSTAEAFKYEGIAAPLTANVVMYDLLDDTILDGDLTRPLPVINNL